MVIIEIHATPSGNITIGSRNINPHAQWLSHHKRPVTISINKSSGNINIVLEIYTYTSSRGYLNTAEIEKHIRTPSCHINTVSINSISIHVQSINMQIHSVVTIIEQQQHDKFLRLAAISIQFEINIYIYILCPVAILILLQ